MFIYVYYELFASINLLDVMPLFFTVLSFYLSIFGKIHLIFGKFARKSSRRILEKITDLSVKSVDKSPKPAEFRYSRFLLFLHRLQCVSVEFFRISPIFFLNFPKNRQNCSGPCFLLPPNFQIFKHCSHRLSGSPLLVSLFTRPHRKTGGSPVVFLRLRLHGYSVVYE
jgi:hypothetical protein